MSIDDYLLKIDRESLTSRQQFNTLRSSNAFKTDQQSVLIKLKNENFQRALKLKSLKELMSAYLCSKSESEPDRDAGSKGDDRNSLMEGIRDYENKAHIESGYSEQLEKMRLNMKENIVIYI